MDPATLRHLTTEELQSLASIHHIDTKLENEEIIHLLYEHHGMSLKGATNESNEDLAVRKPEHPSASETTDQPSSTAVKTRPHDDVCSLHDGTEPVDSNFDTAGFHSAKHSSATHSDHEASHYPEPSHLFEAKLIAKLAADYNVMVDTIGSLRSIAWKAREDAEILRAVLKNERDQRARLEEYMRKWEPLSRQSERGVDLIETRPAGTFADARPYNRTAMTSETPRPSRSIPEHPTHVPAKEQTLKATVSITVVGGDGVELPWTSGPVRLPAVNSPRSTVSPTYCSKRKRSEEGYEDRYHEHLASTSARKNLSHTGGESEQGTTKQTENAENSVCAMCKRPRLSDQGDRRCRRQAERRSRHPLSPGAYPLQLQLQ